VHHIPLDVDVNLNEDKRKKTGWIKWQLQAVLLALVSELHMRRTEKK
jgi:hypothetical protein